MEPIRVLQVVAVMNRGGLETMLMNYYRNIDRSKVQFDFLVHRQERGAYDDEIEKLGGNIFRVPRINPFGHKKYLKALDDFFKANREYRIVHSHINSYSMYVLRTTKQYYVPCTIAHSHIAKADFDFKTPFVLYTKWLLKRYCDYKFACGIDAGRWLYGQDDKEITIMHNAVNCREYVYNPEKVAQIKKILGLEKKFIIGHIGRFNPQKNHEFLVEIFNEIYRLNNNSILLLVGEGSLRSEIEAKIKKLNLVDVVKFLGVRDDVPELLQTMDVLLFPSLYEGLPVTLIEAQAAGLPSVISDHVSAETKISNLVEFISLEESALYWAERVSKYDDGYVRENTYDEIVKHGYDIEENVKWLQRFYLNEYEKSKKENREDLFG